MLTDAAFERELERARKPLFAMAIRLCDGHHDRAEDLAQKTRIRAWKGRNSFQGDAAFTTWLCRVMVNAHLSDVKPRKRRLDVVMSCDLPEARPFSDVGSVVDDYFASQVDPSIVDAINALPIDLRRLLVLSDVEGYQYDECAAALSVPIGTIKSRLHRARKALAKRLPQYA